LNTVFTKEWAVEEDSDDSDESDREIGLNYSSQTLTKKPQIQQSFPQGGKPSMDQSTPSRQFESS